MSTPFKSSTLRTLAAAALLWACTAVAATAQTLTVGAASSLGDAMAEVARAFEGTHPGVSVRVEVAASGDLLDLAAQGKPLDVLATAGIETLTRGAERRLLPPDTPRRFATNTLVLVAPATARNPPLRLADLARADVRRIAMGRPASVPAGRYARQSIDAARLWPALQDKIVLADSARAVLARVARGEADAGFVYATDAATATSAVRVVQTLETPAPIVHAATTVKGSRQEALAREFVAFLSSAPAQAAFARLGFGPP